MHAYGTQLCKTPCVVTARFIPPSENVSEALATYALILAKQVVPLALRGTEKLSNKPQNTGSM